MIQAQAPEFVSARPQARLAVAVLIANIVAGGLAMVAYGVFIAIELAVTLDDSSVQLANYVVAVLLAIYYVTTLLALTTFGIWLHRIATNMPGLGADDVRFRPGSGAYLHPAATAIDAWKGATTDQLRTSRQDRWYMKAPYYYRVWWQLPIGGALLWAYISRRAPSPIPFVPSMNVISLALFVATAALTILVIRQVTARQDRKQELILTGRLA